MQRIQLKIDDKLLCKAVALMLEQLGYMPCTESSVFVITDSKTEIIENTDTLLIGREESADKNYLRRPFGMQELMHAMRTLTGEGEISHTQGGMLRLDRKHKKALLGDEKISLTEKEFALLVLLYESRGKAVSDGEIVQKIWKNETAQGSNIAAVYVNYLRKKLERPAARQLIFRVRGKGYMYKEKEHENA